MAQMQVELHPDVRKFGPEIQGILQQLSSSQIAYFNALYEKRRKDALAAFLLSFLGFDRFYFNQPVAGFIKLICLWAWVLAVITEGVLFPFLGLIGCIWWLVDLASAGSRTRSINESIALATAKEVKDLVDPNAQPPVIETHTLSPILIVLIILAIMAVAFAIALLLAQSFTVY